MVLLISFLIGIQILGGLVTSRPRQGFYSSCISSEIKAAAEAAIDEINADRKEGYILSLLRIFYGHKIPEWDGNSLFFLYLDVIETKCHVLSRKPWKACKVAELFEIMFGQCKVTIHLDKNSNHWHLENYDCLLKPVPATDVLNTCPDCPLLQDPSKAAFQETAAETMAKFNAENEENNYFAILNVTKANYQWVVDSSKYVEYIIQETSCPKNPPVSDITQCPFLPTETAATGQCRGYVVDSQIEKKKFVDVKCKLFPRLPPVTDEQTPQSTSEPQEPHSHPSPTITETSPKKKETVGQVIYHYPWSKDVIPEVQEPNSTSGPTLASPEQGSSPHLAKPFWPPIPPLLRQFQYLGDCPGDVLVCVHGLQLPSWPQAETS